MTQADTSGRARAMSMRKKLVLAAVALALAVGAWVAWVATAPDPLRSPARREWRDRALGSITKLIADQSALDSLASFTKDYAVREFDGRSDDSLKRTWPEP